MSNSSKNVSLCAEDLKPGDLITIQMAASFLWNVYSLQIEHYGIYVGNNQVVHNKPGSGWMAQLGGGVELCEFSEFLKLSCERKQTWVKVNDSCLKTISNGQGSNNIKFYGEETAERSINRIGEQKFHLRNNNSEHFAMECRFGQHSSYQLTKAVMRRLLGGLSPSVGGAWGYL